MFKTISRWRDQRRQIKYTVYLIQPPCASKTSVSRKLVGAVVTEVADRLRGKPTDGFGVLGVRINDDLQFTGGLKETEKLMYSTLFDRLKEAQEQQASIKKDLVRLHAATAAIKVMLKHEAGDETRSDRIVLMSAKSTEEIATWLKAGKSVIDGARLLEDLETLRSIYLEDYRRVNRNIKLANRYKSQLDELGLTDWKKPHGQYVAKTKLSSEKS